ncbi:hypothetical protein C3B79_0969 [Aeromonas hydrophila]|nr:hypothetical protein C3B79_0969 [Aeromonas hydrophila]
MPEFFLSDGPEPSQTVHRFTSTGLITTIPKVVNLSLASCLSSFWVMAQSRRRLFMPSAPDRYS